MLTITLLIIYIFLRLFPIKKYPGKWGRKFRMLKNIHDMRPDQYFALLIYKNLKNTSECNFRIVEKMNNYLYRDINLNISYFIFIFMYCGYLVLYYIMFKVMMDPFVYPLLIFVAIYVAALLYYLYIWVGLILYINSNLTNLLSKLFLKISRVKDESKIFNIK